MTLPLFFPGDLPFRDSIESGYVSMARFFSSHPNPWGWSPTQYCGLPSQFIYLPALHYFTAVLYWVLPGVDLPHLYRMLTVTLACLGPVTMYIFAAYFTRSKWIAFAAALAYTLMSPSYGVFPAVDGDRGLVQLPWRIQVLAKYGEGPHNAGLMLLPLALIAVWVAARGREFRQIFVAAVLLAAIALTNWVAALALGYCCLMLILVSVRTPAGRDFVIWRALAAAALAYLLACFWLTPDFIRTVAFNWPKDAFNYKFQEHQTLLLAGLAAGVAVLRLLFLRFPRQHYLCFLLLSLYGFAYVAFAYYRLGRDTIPESRRYALEFEFFLFLALFELFRLAMRHRVFAVQAAAVCVLAALLSMGGTQAWAYTTKSFSKLKPIPREKTVEYQVARWIAEHPPSGRVFATGGLRFRINSWFDIHQVGGTFESGLKNHTALHYSYQITTGLESKASEDGGDAVRQLKAMGVEYVVVHGAGSREYYRDFKNPAKFEGLLGVIYREGGDTIYRVPYHSLAHLVRESELPESYGKDRIRAYVAAIDDPGRPKFTSVWRGPSELRLRGAVPEGMLLSVKVNHDSGWKVRQDGKPLPVGKDGLGFILLRPSPAPDSDIRLVYEGTGQPAAAAAVSGLAWLGSLFGLVCWGKRKGAG